MTEKKDVKNSGSPPKSESALKSFLSGGVGGVCSVLVGHPFDLVKVRIQAAAANSGLGNTSTFSMIRSTFIKEGISGVYRGVSAPLMATTPMFAVSFWGYDMGKRVVKYVDRKGAIEDEPSYVFTTTQLCVAGGISAFPTTLIMAPSERLKCLLQMEGQAGGNSKPKYSGLFDCARQVYKEGGIRSVFKGTGATLLRDIPGGVAWFGTYEIAKKEFMKIQNIDPATGELSPLSVLTAGGLAGIVCWAITIPADVLKSRFQTAPEGKYRSLYHVYTTLMKEEGPTALFHGIRPALIRAFPANAACFFGMELARDFLSFLDR